MRSDGLDVSMLGVALPSIDADPHLGTRSLPWVVSAYVLGYGGLLPIVTRFSLGLVFGGLLTLLGWSGTFPVPAPIALGLLFAGRAGADLPR